MTDIEREIAAWLANNPDLRIDDDVAGEIMADVSHAIAASVPSVGPSEADVQEALVEWAAYQANAEPELELLYAVPNGGHRIKAVAARLKAQGVKRGVPDLVLPVPRARYHGMFLELKIGDNKPSPEQLVWIERLREQGYWVSVAYGFDEAKAALEWYVSLGRRAVEAPHPAESHMEREARERKRATVNKLERE